MKYGALIATDDVPPSNLVGIKVVMPYDRDEGLDRPRSLHLAGDALCAEICPDIFFMHDDGLAYVKNVDDTGLTSDGQPKLKMATGLADVPDTLLDAVIESAEECPGECIFLEG